VQGKTIGYTAFGVQQFLFASKFLLKMYVLESRGVGAAITLGIACIFLLRYSLDCILYTGNKFKQLLGFQAGISHFEQQEHQDPVLS